MMPEDVRQEADSSAEISGILPIDKPTGMTSHDVVDVVRRLYGVKRVGHTGTLDPAASGLLLVMLGRATRVAPYLSGQDKTYLAAIEFGAVSDTGDSEGTITRTGQAPTSIEQLASVIASFTGEVELEVPAMAAVRSGGTRRYELARRGVDVPKMVRMARIDRIELIEYSSPHDDVAARPVADPASSGAVPVVESQGAESHLPSQHKNEIAIRHGGQASAPTKSGPPRDDPASSLSRDYAGQAQDNQEQTQRAAVAGQGHTPNAMAQIRVRCSSGTYIRSLAQAIGEKCGCGAYLAALRREEIGRANVVAAYRLEYLDMLAFRGEPPVPPEPVDDYLGLPAIVVKAEAWESIHHGRALAKRDFVKVDDDVTANGNVVLRMEQGEVVAIATSLYDAEGMRGENVPDEEQIVTYRCVLI